jgi:hypothetical protein
MAVLSFFHDHPKESFPKDFLSQTTIEACLRAVRVNVEGSLRPPLIKTKWTVVESYLQKAQEKLVSITPPEYWPHLPQFEHTFKQSARSYETVLINNLWMYAAKRLETVIKAEVTPRLLESPDLKSSTSYIYKVIFRKIVRANTITNIESYKNKENIRLYATPFLESDFVRGMIKEHQTWLKDAFEQLKTTHFTHGVLSEENVKKRPHLFLNYELFLAQRLDIIRDAEAQTEEKTKKATFTIIPQLTMKRRYVTFGKEQTTELLWYLAKQDQAGDFIRKEQVPTKVKEKEKEIENLGRQAKTLRSALIRVEEDFINNKDETALKRKHACMDSCRTKLWDKETTLLKERHDQHKRKRKECSDKPPKKKQKLSSWQQSLTRDQVKYLWSKDLGLFSCPNKIRKGWAGIVTTDGVIASWHLHKEDPTVCTGTEKKTKKKKTAIVVTKLENKLYGTHSADDVLFDFKNQPVNIIAIDPGHDELIHAVRLHKTEQGIAVLDACLAPLLPTLENTSKATRHRAKYRFLKNANKSTFKLTNKQWAHDTGRLAQRKKTQKLHKNLGLQPAIDILAAATSKTTSLETYFQHVVARVKSAPAFIQLMRIKRTSRWKFETFQREKRAVKQLSADLLGGMDSNNTICAWGNGGFASTSKGHDSAPNKRLRLLLSRYMPIVMNTEYNTTKLSCCCHVEGTKLTTKDYKRRWTVKRCDGQHESDDGTTSKCGKLLGRDENAAHNILYIFKEQHEDEEGAVPVKFRP